MSAWRLWLVGVVAVVLLLVVVLASRSRQTEPDEPSPREPARAVATARSSASSKPAWKGERIPDRDARPQESEVDRGPRDAADAIRAKPAAPLPGAKRLLAEPGAAAEAEGEKSAGGAPGGPDVALTEAATASGVTPRFAAFGEGSGGAALGSTPSEQENVEFDDGLGAYFPPNAVLGYPGRGGLQVEAGTVMFWVQPVDWDGATNIAYSFFLLRDTSSLRHQFAILTDQRSLRFQIVNADGIEFDVLAPIDDWQRGEWHHVAATWGDSLMDLWVDGALVGEQAIDGIPAVPPNSPAYWGSSRGTAGAGAILANGRIFDSVLSVADIGAEAQRVPR
jgi:hypothetical protein